MPLLHTAINARTVLSAAASALLVKAIASQLIPRQLQSHLVSKLHRFFSAFSTQLTLVVDEFQGMKPNQIFEAAHVYLGAKVSNSHADRITVGKGDKDKNLTTAVGRNQQISDTFGTIHVTWKLVHARSRPSTNSNPNHWGFEFADEARSYEITFHKRHLQEVLHDYLPYVVSRSKILLRQNGREISIHTTRRRGRWNPEAIRLDHPMSFDNLAMDPELKKALVEDLNTFVNGKAYHRRIGRAWRRSYLLSGPPGSGKSSLVAAMARLLGYDVFYLDLTEVRRGSELKSLLSSTPRRSMLVVEDVNVAEQSYNVMQTLAGLRSCCADEQVVVLTSTAGYEDGFGRVDVHVRLSYCGFAAFRQLAFSYLRIDEHELFPAVEKLLAEVDVAAAEIAGVLLTKSGEDAESAVRGVIALLDARKSRRRVEMDGGVDADGSKRSVSDSESSCNLAQRSSRRGGLRRRGRPVRVVL
uniref:AAA+ ATPase domain-containing protein n=1 Tax=Kalanchoe fedtschenkoi TaxID=63787 RepID=A0A7N0UA51_KALFE